MTVQRQCSGQARGCLLTVPARVTRASENGLVLTAEPERLLSSGLLSTFFDAVRSKVALQLVLWFRVPFLAMVTQGEILFLLGVVGDFLFRERPHTDLVPLLQACTSFRALHTHLQSYLDDTVRAVQRLAGAWRMGTSRVFFHIRVGTPARLAVRRGHREKYDISLMSAVGYLPATLVERMERAGSTYVRARNARAFPTGNGHVQIEELEARGRFAGNHYFYYCSSIVTHFAEEIPSDFEELSFSDADSSTSESFL